MYGSTLQKINNNNNSGRYNNMVLLGITKVFVVPGGTSTIAGILVVGDELIRLPNGLGFRLTSDIKFLSVPPLLTVGTQPLILYLVLLGKHVWLLAMHMLPWLCIMKSFHVGNIFILHY